MEKQFIVSDDEKEKIKLADDKLSRNFPRIISQINRQRNGWLISISGPDNEFKNYIDELKNNIDFDL
jgi:hypothetical protein